MQAHVEIQKYVLALAFGALGTQFRDPLHPDKEGDLLKLSEGMLRITEGNEQFKPYLKEIFELARQAMYSMQSSK